MGLQEQFSKEFTVMKEAPSTFFIGFVVLAVIIAIGEYQLFVKEAIAQKDDVIRTKNELIETLERKLKSSTPISPEVVKPSTGAAAANGNGNTVITGNDSKINELEPAQ